MLQDSVAHGDVKAAIGERQWLAGHDLAIGHLWESGLKVARRSESDCRDPIKIWIFSLQHIGRLTYHVGHAHIEDGAGGGRPRETNKIAIDVITSEHYHSLGQRGRFRDLIVALINLLVFGSVRLRGQHPTSLPG